MNHKTINKLRTMLDVFIIIGMIPFTIKFEMLGFGWIINLHKFIFYLYGYYLILDSIKNIIRNKKINLFSYYNLGFFIFLVIDSLFVSNSKLDSLMKIFTLFITYLFGCSIIYRYKIKDILRITNYANIIVVFITIIFTLLYKNMAFEPYENKLVLSGSFPTKNNLATYMVFVFIVAFCYMEFIKRKLLYKAFIIITIGLILMSGSMTSIVTLVIILLVYYVNKLVKWKLNVVNIGIIFNLITYFVVIYQEIINKSSTEILGRNLTLTGRIYIWEAIINQIIKVKSRLFFGYGYGTFWGYNSVIENSIILGYKHKIGNVVVAGSHNSFLELILQIGIIGIIILLFNFIKSGINITKIKNIQFKKFSSMIYIYIFIYFITERSFWNMNYQTLFIFIILEATLNKNIIFKMEEENENML